jgi:hypothetical protein
MKGPRLWWCLMLLAVVLAGCKGCAAAHGTAPDDCPSNPEWGTFGPPPEIEIGAGSQIDILKSEFLFTEQAGREWKARKGLHWDGASIPRVLWSLVGSPKTGCYRWASIVHDEVYRNRGEYVGRGVSRKDADEMFYKACRAKGVGRAKAATMYYALRWFGDRWDTQDLAVDNSFDEVGQKELLQRLELSLERDGFRLFQAESDPEAREAWVDATAPSALRARLPELSSFERR